MSVCIAIAAMDYTNIVAIGFPVLRKSLARIEHTRALRITECGHTGLRAVFGLAL